MCKLFKKQTVHNKNKILKNKKESIAASDIIKAYEVLDSFINKNNIKIKYPSQQGN